MWSARMWSDGVVVLLPGGKLDAGVSDRREERFVQAFVAEPAVEAFNEAVLHWLAGRDIVPVHGSFLAPAQDRYTGEFGAIVANDGSRLCPTLPDECVQLAGDTVTRQRGIRYQR